MTEPTHKYGKLRVAGESTPQLAITSHLLDGFYQKHKITNVDVEKQKPWESKFVQPLWKTVQQFLKQLKTQLPYDSMIPFLGKCPKELK